MHEILYRLCMTIALPGSSTRDLVHETRFRTVPVDPQAVQDAQVLARSINAREVHVGQLHERERCQQAAKKEDKTD